MVKNLPAMQETRAWFPGQEDPLQKAMAIHFSILACRIPWTEEPGKLPSPAHHSRTLTLPLLQPTEFSAAPLIHCVPANRQSSTHTICSAWNPIVVHLLIFCFDCAAFGILVPWSGIEPVSHAVEMRSLNHYHQGNPTVNSFKMPLRHYSLWEALFYPQSWPGFLLSNSTVPCAFFCHNTCLSVV